MPRLVPALEEFGYHRYWATEHYSPSQSASPAVLAGMAAQLTSHMRIGTAGVLLTLAPPLRVINDFMLLELLHPGRIDMGMAGATGDDLVAKALSNDIMPAADTYQTRLRELAKLQRLASWHTGDALATVIGPRPNVPPPMWVCGTGHVSAQLAGDLGAAYAFHDHLSPVDADGASVLRTYRDAFRPSMFRSQPEIVVACTGAVGDTDASAQTVLRDRGLTTASFSGTAQSVGDQLCCHAESYDVDELAIYLVSPSIDEQLQGYHSLAEIIGI